MNDDDAVGRKLLEQLLNGQRGDIPLHLAMLLEKSSPLRNNDEHYRRILPRDLATLNLSHDTVHSMVHVLHQKIAQQPDAALISVISTTGFPETTRFVAEFVAHPPRPLKVDEYQEFLGILYRYLPHRLASDPHFLTSSTKSALLTLLADLQNSPHERVRKHAGGILKQLKDLNVLEGPSEPS